MKLWQKINVDTRSRTGLHFNRHWIKENHDSIYWKIVSLTFNFQLYEGSVAKKMLKKKSTSWSWRRLCLDPCNRFGFIFIKTKSEIVF